jgi:hypothetical protein
MRTALRCLLPGLALCACLTFPALSFAQVEDPDDEEETAAGDTENEAAEEAGARPEVVAASPEAPPTWFFGAYFQTAFVPSFMLKLFLDEAPTVTSLGFGVTATHRNKDGMSLVIGLGYASYSFEGPFKIKGDPDTDTEWLSSSLGLLHLRGQMLWSTELVPSTLSFEYGVGLDIGVVLGQLKRTEAYRDASGNLQKCAGPGNPLSGMYCELPQNLAAGTDGYNQQGAHYNVVEKRVPPVMLIPMLPVLALRYTPIPKLAVKLDAAFGLMQFSLGLSAAYGVNL